jgi:GxxExxY protein
LHRGNGQANPVPSLRNSGPPLRSSVGQGKERSVQLDPAVNVLTSRIIGAAIEVHRTLGPGLLESAYEECLAREFALRDLPFERQLEVPLTYKGVSLEAAFRLDFVVAGQVAVELKAVEALLPVHTAQLLSYLQFTGLPIGLLVNFHVVLLRDGVRRYLNRLRGRRSEFGPDGVSEEPVTYEGT